MVNKEIPSIETFSFPIVNLEFGSFYNQISPLL